MTAGSSLIPRRAGVAWAAAAFALGAVVLTYVALALMPKALPVAIASEAPPAALVLEEQAATQANPKLRRRSRCKSCGVVETIHRLEPIGDAAGRYEFTLRMRDGSTRTRSGAGLASWQVGDRITVIGPAEPA
jgi:hypothetical protein